MKIALECKDLIIERTLEIFLKEHLVMKKDCDFLVVDKKINSLKPQFIISKESPYLKIPFNKDELFNCLFEFDEALKQLAIKLALEEKKKLEAQMDMIINQTKKEYQEKLDQELIVLKDKLLKVLDNG